MTTDPNPVPAAVVQIAADVIDRTHEGSPYIALDVCNALARAGWLHDPTRVADLEAGREVEQRALRNAITRLAELEAKNERLTTLVDAAHGIICNAHQKRVDDVTTDDGASPGWAEAARRWIDAYPFGSLDTVADEAPEQEEA